MKTNEDRKIGYAKQLRHALRKAERDKIKLHARGYSASDKTVKKILRERSSYVSYR